MREEESHRHTNSIYEYVKCKLKNIGLREEAVKMQRVCRDGRTDTQADLIGRLCESEASLVIHFKDFLDGVDIGRSPQVQPQVVLVGCAHNLLGRKNKMEYYRFIFTKHFLCKISSTLKKHLWLLQQAMCWD